MLALTPLPELIHSARVNGLNVEPTWNPPAPPMELSTLKLYVVLESPSAAE